MTVTTLRHELSHSGRAGPGLHCMIQVSAVASFMKFWSGVVKGSLRRGVRLTMELVGMKTLCSLSRSIKVFLLRTGL